MESELLYCNPFDPRMLSIGVAIQSSARKPSKLSKTTSVIAHGTLRLPGHCEENDLEHHPAARSRA
jgi:hypothetical protein